MEHLYTSWIFWAQIGLTAAVGVALLLIVLRGVAALQRYGKLSPIVVRPLRIVLKVVGSLIIAGLVFERFGINVMTTLATLLAMVAIGVIAVWSMLSHITATFLLLINKPFLIDDHVKLAGEEVAGRVVDLSLFYTTLEGKDGEFFKVPNNMFFQKTLQVRRGKARKSLADQLKADGPDQV